MALMPPMRDADYTRLARTGAVCTYMQHRRSQRVRRLKLAAAVLLTLAVVVAVAWWMPG